MSVLHGSGWYMPAASSKDVKEQGEVGSLKRCQWLPSLSPTPVSHGMHSMKKPFKSSMKEILYEEMDDKRTHVNTYYGLSKGLDVV